MISDPTIQQAVATWVVAAKPQQILLFGSYARGDAGEVANRAREMVRLRRALRPLRLPVDVVVVSSDELARDTREAGPVYRWALKEGQVMHG